MLHFGQVWEGMLMKEVFVLEEMDKAAMRRYGLAPEKLTGCSVCSFSFGEKVISEGEASGKLFIVTQGKAKVGITAPNGKDLVLCFYLSDGLIGELEMFCGAETDTTSVTAAGTLHCISIPIAGNFKYLDSNLAFTKIAASELAKKLLRSSNSVVESTLYAAETRLCRYILAASDGGYFRDIMADVAYSIGTSYRHLYRMIGVLCKEGILEKTDAGYRIIDADCLMKRAQQN